MAVDRRRVHARVPGPEGRPRRHERRRDRDTARVGLAAWCAPRPCGELHTTPSGIIARWVIGPRPGALRRVRLSRGPRPRLHSQMLVLLVNPVSEPSHPCGKGNPSRSLIVCKVDDGQMRQAGLWLDGYRGCKSLSITKSFQSFVRCVCEATPLPHASETAEL